MTKTAKQKVAFVVDIRGNWMDINWKGWDGQPIMLSFHKPTAEKKAELHKAMVDENIARICELWDEDH